MKSDSESIRLMAYTPERKKSFQSTWPALSDAKRSLLLLAQRVDLQRMKQSSHQITGFHGCLWGQTVFERSQHRLLLSNKSMYFPSCHEKSIKGFMDDGFVSRLAALRFTVLVCPILFFNCVINL